MVNGPKVAILLETEAVTGPLTTLPLGFPQPAPVYILRVMVPPALVPDEPVKVAVSLTEPEAGIELAEGRVASVGLAMLTVIGPSHMLVPPLLFESPL